MIFICGLDGSKRRRQLVDAHHWRCTLLSTLHFRLQHCTSGNAHDLKQCTYAEMRIVADFVLPETSTTHLRKCAWFSSSVQPVKVVLTMQNARNSKTVPPQHNYASGRPPHHSPASAARGAFFTAQRNLNAATREVEITAGRSSVTTNSRAASDTPRYIPATTTCWRSCDVHGDSGGCRWMMGDA